METAPSGAISARERGSPQSPFLKTFSPFTFHMSQPYNLEFPLETSGRFVMGGWEFSSGRWFLQTGEAGYPSPQNVGEGWLITVSSANTHKASSNNHWEFCNSYPGTSEDHVTIQLGVLIQGFLNFLQCNSIFLCHYKSKKWSAYNGPRRWPPTLRGLLHPASASVLAQVDGLPPPKTDGLNQFLPF